MKSIAQKLDELIPHHTRLPILCMLVATLMAILIQCCASRDRSDSQMLRVLNAENDLLEKLQRERRGKVLTQKLEADEVLAQAENDLRDSIEALIKANAELRLAQRQRLRGLNQNVSEGAKQ